MKFQFRLYSFELLKNQNHMCVLFVIFFLFFFFLSSVLIFKYTRGDQKVRGKVLLNRIAFIDCNENS